MMAMDSDDSDFDPDMDQENSQDLPNVSPSQRKPTRARLSSPRRRSSMPTNQAVSEFIRLEEQIDRKMTLLIDSSNVSGTVAGIIKDLEAQDQAIRNTDDRAVAAHHVDSRLISKVAQGTLKITRNVELVHKPKFTQADFSRLVAESLLPEDLMAADLAPPFTITFKDVLTSDEQSMVRCPDTVHLANQWPIPIPQPTPSTSTQTQTRNGPPGSSTEEEGVEPKKRRRGILPKGPSQMPQNIDKDHVQEGNVDETSEEVKALYTRLKRIRIENGGNKVRYIKWVCDPDSFGQTIENIFHGMFLLKKGEISMSQGSDGNAYVDTISGSRQRNSMPGPGGDVPDPNQPRVAVKGTQCILNFTYSNWQQWCQLLEDGDVQMSSQASISYDQLPSQGSTTSGSQSFYQNL